MKLLDSYLNFAFGRHGGSALRWFVLVDLPIVSVAFFLGWLAGGIPCGALAAVGWIAGRFMGAL